MDTMAQAGRQPYNSWTGGQRRYSWTAGLLVFLLISLVAGYCGAQSKEDYYEDLFHPVAAERVKAAIEYAKLCTVEDLTKMLDGYRTRYWNGTEYEYTEHPPERQAFATVILQWPDCIDEEFVDHLYEYEEPQEFPRFELADIIAAALLENAPRLESETLMGERVREAWYVRWFASNSQYLDGLVWSEMYEAIGDIDWLFNKLVCDPRLGMYPTLILGVFNNKLDDVIEILRKTWARFAEYDFETSYPWVFTVDSFINGDAELPATFEDEPSLSMSIYTNLDYILVADYIALMTDNREMLSSIDTLVEQADLSEVHYEFQVWGLRTRDIDPRYMLLRSENLRDDLESLWTGDRPWDRPTSVNHEVLLNHPWFSDMRAEDGFEEWWNEWNHQTPYKEADPYFGVPHD